MRALLVFTFVVVIMGSGFDEASAKPIAAKGVHYKKVTIIMRDASSGLPTGKRMHKPMVIKKDAPLQPTLLESGGPSGGNAPAAMGAPLNSPATGRGTIR